MSDPKLQTAEDKLKETIRTSFSLTGLEEEVKAHLEEMKEFSSDIRKKLKDLSMKALDALEELSRTTDQVARHKINRRIGSYKHSYMSYLKAIEESAKWQAAQLIWNNMEKAKNIISAVLDLAL